MAGAPMHEGLEKARCTEFMQQACSMSQDTLQATDHEGTTSRRTTNSTAGGRMNRIIDFDFITRTLRLEHAFDQLAGDIGSRYIIGSIGDGLAYARYLPRTAGRGARGHCFDGRCFTRIAGLTGHAIKFHMPPLNRLLEALNNLYRVAS